MQRQGHLTLEDDRPRGLLARLRTAIATWLGRSPGRGDDGDASRLDAAAAARLAEEDAAHRRSAVAKLRAAGETVRSGAVPKPPGDDRQTAFRTDLDRALRDKDGH